MRILWNNHEQVLGRPLETFSKLGDAFRVNKTEFLLSGAKHKEPMAPSFKEQFEILACSADTYQNFLSIISGYDNETRKIFITALAEFLETSGFDEIVEMFLEDVYMPTRKELDKAISRWRLIDEDVSLLGGYYAKQDWIEKKVSDLEKMKTYISSNIGHYPQPRVVRDERILLNVTKFDPDKFVDFAYALRKKHRLISSNTTLEQLRDLFNLDKSYHRNEESGGVKKPVTWTGTNYQLHLLIDVMERDKLIKFHYNRKWEAVCASFVNKQSVPFNPTSLRHPNSKKKATIIDQINSIVRSLV